MRIIPKNTKVSTEFFKGVTLADMIVGFIGVLIIFLIAVSSLPYRGYIAIAFGFILVFLLVRIDDESNYMFFFRIIRHLSYFRSYRKPGFEYPKPETMDDLEENNDMIGAVEEINVNNAEDERIEEAAKVAEELDEWNSKTLETSLDVSGDVAFLEKEPEITQEDMSKEELAEDEIHPMEEESTKEANPLHVELEEGGFEVLDLDEISLKEKSIKKTTKEIVESRQKAPQSVLKNIRNKPSKVKKGDS